MSDYKRYKRDYYGRDHPSDSYKRYGSGRYNEERKYNSDNYRRVKDKYSHESDANMEDTSSPESSNRRYGTKEYERPSDHPHSSKYSKFKYNYYLQEGKTVDRSGYSRRRDHEKHISYDTDENPSSNENDKYSTIIVRTLDPDITEENVENAISDLAIRNGFSLPNLVNLKKLPNSTISGVYFGSDNSTHTPQILNEYSYTFGFEKIALVTFPSSSAATRFMESVKSRMLRICDKEYYVEFDTSISGYSKSVALANDSSVPDLNEIASLLQKRKLQSDWNCPSCRFLNFARRISCLSCGIPRPPDSVLESQNIATGIAAINQAQMLQSNISDISHWIVLKNVPGNSNPAELILRIIEIIPDSPQQLHKCIYVADPNSQTKRGFIFLNFLSSSPVEKYIANRGEKKSDLIKLGDSYHRMDTVRAREKHVAEELFKKIKFTSTRIYYEFDTLALGTTLISENYTKISNHKEHHSFKIKTTDIKTLEVVVNSSDAPSTTSNYFSTWVSDSIWVSTGKPDTASFVYDPSTDYFFDHKLSLYYDAASGYYMSLTGNYYIWDDQSSSLRIVNNEDITSPVPGPVEKNIGSTQKIGVPSNISGVIEAAMKVAQVSKENTQQISSVIEKKKDCIKTKRNILNFGETFTKGSVSDGECDMDLEDNSDEESSKIVHKISKDTNPKDDTIQEPKLKTLNICFVCIRTFDTDEDLHIHKRDSKYHQTLLSLTGA